MPNCRKTRFFRFISILRFQLRVLVQQGLRGLFGLVWLRTPGGPVDVTHWQFVQCLSHRPTSLLFPAKPAGQPAARHYLHARAITRSGFQRHNAFQIHPPASGNLLNLLRLWRIVGIAADPNRRDPGGKGKFSVGGRKRVMTRGAALSHSGARKRQGDQRPEQ